MPRYRFVSLVILSFKNSIRPASSSDFSFAVLISFSCFKLQVAEHAKIYGRNGKHSCYSVMPL